MRAKLCRFFVYITCIIWYIEFFFLCNHDFLEQKLVFTTMKFYDTSAKVLRWSFEVFFCFCFLASFLASIYERISEKFSLILGETLKIIHSNRSTEIQYVMFAVRYPYILFIKLEFYSFPRSCVSVSHNINIWTVEITYKSFGSDYVKIPINYVSYKFHPW